MGCLIQKSPRYIESVYNAIFDFYNMYCTEQVTNLRCIQSIISSDSMMIDLIVGVKNVYPNSDVKVLDKK